MASQLRDPEVLLETMFLIRHELITTRTMAAQCHDIWAGWPGSSGSPTTRTPASPATSPTSSTGSGRWPTASRSSCSA